MIKNLNIADTGASGIRQIENPESNEWLICYQNPANGVFYEWGHAGICYECAIMILK